MFSWMNMLVFVRRVVVCPSGAWVMMFFSAASARAWGERARAGVLYSLWCWGLCTQRRRDALGRVTWVPNKPAFVSSLCSTCVVCFFMPLVECRTARV